MGPRQVGKTLSESRGRGNFFSQRTKKIQAHEYSEAGLSRGAKNTSKMEQCQNYCKKASSQPARKWRNERKTRLAWVRTGWRRI